MAWALLEVGIFIALVLWIVWMVKPPKGSKNRGARNRGTSSGSKGKEGNGE